MKNFEENGEHIVFKKFSHG